MKLPSCPRTLIINVLRKHPDGLTLTSIAKLTGLHRHTATKYVYELKGAGVISERDIGSAKLCYLKEGFSKSDEKKLVQRLNGNKKSSVGQMQILTAFLFLFLVPATIIIAQNVTMNSTVDGNLVFEQTNISVFGGDFNKEKTTEILGQNENSFEKDINENIYSGQTVGNQIVEKTSEANFSVRDEEVTLENETVLPEHGIFENETSGSKKQESTANETIEENENQTFAEHETIPIEKTKLEIPEPILEVEILSPERITRGEEFEIIGIVRNSGTGYARNVRLFWKIPNGFEIISGEKEKDCETLPTDSECSSNLTLSSSLSTDVGRKGFKLLVEYEK